MLIKPTVNITIVMLNQVRCPPYFCHPWGSFTYRGHNHQFRHLTYIKYFSLFHLQKYDENRALNANYFVKQPNAYGQPQMHVILRNEFRPHLAHIHQVTPSHGEVFYLRTLLQHCTYTSHEDARTVDGVIYDTYQEVAAELGLFANEKEAEYCTISTYSSPLVTCDRHEEMSISSIPEMRCDILSISSSRFLGS